MSTAAIIPIRETKPLLMLAEVRDALAEVVSIGDALPLISKAEALRVCCRKAGLSVEIQNQATEVKLRCEREAGRLIRLGQECGEISTRGGDRANFHDGSLKLDDIGITHKQSHRWQRLNAIDAEQFEEELELFHESDREITTAHFLKLAARQSANEEESEESSAIGGDVVANLQELIDAGRKFRTVYADPPWRYGNQATRASTDNHYQTMTVDEICAEPVSQLLEDNAHLHLWTTNAFLFESKRVLEAWGFEYKSCFIWCKKQMGIGNYWRLSHEFLILGVRGSQRFRDKSLMSWLETESSVAITDRTKHSQKPRAVRLMVEKASRGPYLEMYGREAMPDSPWTVYGNQVGKRMF